MAKRRKKKKTTAKRKTKKKAAKRKTKTSRGKKKKATKRKTKKKTAKKKKKKTTGKRKAKKKTAKRKTKARKTKRAAKGKRKPNAAFMKPLTPSDVLARIVGTKPLPRTEVTKKLWGYIKKNKLQDAVERRFINADENLKKLFGGKQRVNMFEMTKHVAKHLK